MCSSPGRCKVGLFVGFEIGDGAGGDVGSQCRIRGRGGGPMIRIGSIEVPEQVPATESYDEVLAHVYVPRPRQDAAC